MTKQQVLILLAFATTYFVWGSTYLVNYWAIDSLPPFGMTGVRFTLAGTLLWGIAWLRGDRTPLTARQWGNSVLLGVLFLSLGVGVIVWAQQWVDTSMAALLVSFEPLLVLLLVWAVAGERPPGRALVGVALGVLGMGVLVGQPDLIATPESVVALSVVSISLIAWSVGLVLKARLDTGESNLRSTAAQMIGGGVVAGAFSLLIGEWNGWSADQLSWLSILSISYLMIVGGIIAFSAFNFLIKAVGPSKASTNTYVNPVVAVALGAAFNGEIITTQSLLAGALLLAGVYFINSAKTAAAPDN